MLAVFDSGLGSLSIVMPIRRALDSPIIYYADEASFPYGTKSAAELKSSILSAIAVLRAKFDPDLIIVGSNTPSLLLPEIFSENIIGVLPPLKRAKSTTSKNSVAVLTTRSVASGAALRQYAAKVAPGIQVHPIDCTEMIRLVESCSFVHDTELCKKEVRNTLGGLDEQCDVATLSSTHLPFLKSIMEKEFPSVKFLDPADDVVQKVSEMTGRGGDCSLVACTSGDVPAFSVKLQKLGIKCSVKGI